MRYIPCFYLRQNNVAIVPHLYGAIKNYIVVRSVGSRFADIIFCSHLDKQSKGIAAVLNHGYNLYLWLKLSPDTRGVATLNVKEVTVFVNTKLKLDV